MDFIGDLSREDAGILEWYGQRAPRILEFGAGGSTQIFAQCEPDVLISVETAPEWVEKTKKNIAQYSPVTQPIFVTYGSHPRQEYDLIFVDGIWGLRKDFAQTTWPLLANHGWMIFHDTRRSFDAENVFTVARMFYDEVLKIEVNEEQSNCTVVHKRPRLEYVDWNKSEGKPAWAYGIGDPPEGI